MSSKYLEAMFETGGPGTSAGASSSHSTKQIFLPATAFSFDADPTYLDRDNEMRGFNEPIRSEIEAYAPGFTLAMRLYPDSAAFALKLLYGAPTTVAGDGVITDLNSVIVPIGAHRHRWTAPFAASGAPVTARMRVGMADEMDGAVYYELRGASLSSIEIATPDTGGVTLTATGAANWVDPISDPSLVPAYESLAIEAFMRSHAALTYLAGSAETDTIGWTLTNPKQHRRPFGSQSKYPTVVEYVPDGSMPTQEFAIDKLGLDATDWQALRDSTRFTMLTSWIHTDAIAASYPFKVNVQGPSNAASLVDGGEVSVENRRRTPMSYSGRLSRDAAASCVIEVVNATPSYA